MPRVLLRRYHFESLDKCTFIRIPLVDRILARDYCQGFQSTELECSVYEGRKQENEKERLMEWEKGGKDISIGIKTLKMPYGKPAIIESSNNICINK